MEVFITKVQTQKVLSDVVTVWSHCVSTKSPVTKGEEECMPSIPQSPMTNNVAEHSALQLYMRVVYQQAWGSQMDYTLNKYCGAWGNRANIATKEHAKRDTTCYLPNANAFCLLA